LKVYENRLLREIFEPKREEVKGSWREVYNEVVHILYHLLIINGVKEVKRMDEMGDIYNTREKRRIEILVTKSEGKKPLGRYGCRWNGLLKWILKDSCMSMWTGFVWFRRALVNTVMKLRVP